MIGLMSLRSRRFLTTYLHFAVWTGALTAGAHAQNLTDLYLPRSYRAIQVRDIVDDSLKSGEFASAQNELTALAAQWKSAGDQSAWLEAQTGWLELEMADDPTADAGDALAELAGQARAWSGHEGAEARIYTLWARMLERQGDWISALHAHDAASQAMPGSSPTVRAKPPGVRAWAEAAALVTAMAMPIANRSQLAARVPYPTL